MRKSRIEISDEEVVKFNEIWDKLEILYPEENLEVPPAKYAIGLVYALWKNDPVLLMKMLDSQDINPWDIDFVEDGLGDDSPDQQSMVEFAARKSSWGCVSILIQHYHDCREQFVLNDEIVPVLTEYEAAMDPERLTYLEAKMRAYNKGAAAYLSTPGEVDFVFHPAYLNHASKSSRFMFEDFSKFKFAGKKNGSPIENKRLNLRQKVYAAISVGDAIALGSALNILKVNAVAYETAKRKGHDALTRGELCQFISAALSCNYPECVVKIMSKVLEFKKAISRVSAAGKTLDEESLKVLATQDSVEQLVMISNLVKDIDDHQSSSQVPPATLIEESFEKVVSELLIKVQDVAYIDRLKSECVANLTVMKDCVNRACERAASQIEKTEIESSMPVNNETVSLPRERVRL